MAKRSMSVWSCSGKHPFADFCIARKVARRMSQKGPAVTAYRCTDCEAWHVGNTSPKTRPDRKGARAGKGWWRT